MMFKNTKFGNTKYTETKFATVSKSLVMVAALLLASSAFAGTKGNLDLSSATTVNGTQLKPGSYKLEWEGSGPDVQLSIMQGKNVITKVPAHVVDLPTPSENAAAVVTTNSDGSKSLTEVRFGGKKYALDLNGSADGTSASK